MHVVSCSDVIQSTNYSAPIHVITGGSGATLHNLVCPFDSIFEYVNTKEHGISLLEVSGKKNEWRFGPWDG